jgi:membrane-anchored glycerophosphoryl diester phosphodiesterase (GDPDase)
LPAKQACFFIHTTYWKLLAVQLRVSSAAADAAGQKKKTKTKTKKKKQRFSLIYFVCLFVWVFSFFVVCVGESSLVGRCV